ncbi:MAG: AAA family ATPase [Fimbriiglobus sp.]|nr:AAA family ATPase [Fimbriiglobus sp.]
MPRRTLTPLSQVRVGQVEWLWKPFIARGNITLLDGDPGVGKSLITIGLAARLSRGGVLPDGRPVGPPRTVLLLNAEDGAAEITRPRAIAADADLDRLYIVGADKDEDPIIFPDYLPDLEAHVHATKADLVVIDPFLAYLPPKVSAGIDQCVRTALTPLAALAERTGCAVLLIRHLRKTATGNALRRGQGSMAIIGAARTGLLAGRHPADSSLGVLGMTKTNLAGEVKSFAYRIVSGANDLPVVEWVGPVDVPADAIGGLPPSRMPARDRAGGWLREQLANGPRRTTDLFTTASEAHIPERTLYRARKEVGVKSHAVRAGDSAEWYWYDPNAPWPADAPFPKPAPECVLPPIGE